MRNKECNRNNHFRSKKLAPANYLIVCEGKQTEPNYFEGLKKKINEKYNNKVDIIKPEIKIRGTGRNTMDLVNYTEKFINHANKEYGQVWAVFDKDDYSDNQFDEAIKKCDHNVAWSNPNFELWLLSHLKPVTNYISKDNILKELNKEFQKNGLGEYKKNDENIFEKITGGDKLSNAIDNCKSMEKINENANSSQRNPMTQVYKIVEGLKEYL